MDYEGQHLALFSGLATAAMLAPEAFFIGDYVVGETPANQEAIRQLVENGDMALRRDKPSSGQASYMFTEQGNRQTTRLAKSGRLELPKPG